MLIDGARIHASCPNKMDPAASHVDFAKVRHVEVTRGPFDMTTQGSLAGAIRIVGKTPAEGLVITPALSAGSFGYYNPSLVASLAKARVFGLAGYSFRRARAFVDGSGKPFTSYANYRPEERAREAFDAGTAWFRAGGMPIDQIGRASCRERV